MMNRAHVLMSNKRKNRDDFHLVIVMKRVEPFLYFRNNSREAHRGTISIYKEIKTIIIRRTARE